MAQSAACAQVYILRCSNGSLYTGWTTDLQRRVADHSAGRGGRYTRSRRPLQLVYAESHPSRSAAMQREAAIKRWPRARKLALIASVRETHVDNMGELKYKHGHNSSDKDSEEEE
jgi:putative endonuclease